MLNFLIKQLLIKKMFRQHNCLINFKEITADTIYLKVSFSL